MIKFLKSEDKEESEEDNNTQDSLKKSILTESEDKQKCVTDIIYKIYIFIINR